MWYSIELDDRQHRMAAAENDRDNTFIPNPKDWDIFWNKRKDFLDSLSEQEKGIWESELKSNMTPLEREYYDANKLMQPYLGLNSKIINGTGSLEISAPNGTNDFFLLKSSSLESLQVNNQGVMVLGGFTFTPTAVRGGVYYNNDEDEFFVGKNN